jgi:hypothetical protein
MTQGVPDVDVTIPFTIGGTATEGANEDFTTSTSPVVKSARSQSETITLYIDDATDITITDILPADMTYISHQADRGTYDLESGECFY